MLAPVVQQLAQERNLQTALVVDEAEETDYSRTDWVLVTRNADLLATPSIANVASKIDSIPRLAVWTDDYNNLFRILK
jgi:hypothetical protein